MYVINDENQIVYIATYKLLNYIPLIVWKY